MKNKHDDLEGCLCVLRDCLSTLGGIVTLLAYAALFLYLHSAFLPSERLRAPVQEVPSESNGMLVNNIL